MSSLHPQLKIVLLLSVSALALSAQASAADLGAPTIGSIKDQPIAVSGRPALFLSLEGGAACAFGDEQKITSAPVGGYPGVSGTLGNNGCGWTGRVAIGQEARRMAGGLFDYWSLAWRETRTRKDSFQHSASSPGYYYGGSYNSTLDGERKERRTVIDFEVGRDLGLGLGEGHQVRLFGGLRYARFRADTSLTGTSQYVYYGYGYSSSTAAALVRTRFWGIGPRIGLSGRIPLWTGFGIVWNGSASVLWGNQDVHATLTGLGPAVVAGRSGSDWVGNLEGETGLSFTPMGAHGAEIVVGVRAEAWFDQDKARSVNIDAGSPSLTVSGDLDRHNWGPFARVKIPLGSP